MNKNRVSSCVRVGSAALLLAILGVCGYVGANQPQAKTVSVPVIRESMAAQAVEQGTPEQIRQRLEESRREEIALLDSVLDDPKASEENRQSALAQKTQIAARMDAEARVRAGLSYLGYEDANVLCGEESVMVFAAYDLSQEKQRMQIIDAAASTAQLAPENVKIILVKK